MSASSRHPDEPPEGGRVALAYESRLNTEPGQNCELLFAAHQQRLLRAAYRITGNMADAEDVAQSVFLRLLRTGAEEVDHPESYLYRAAINGALDVMRRRTADRSVALDEAAELHSVRPEGAPDRAASSRELRTWLRQALSSLSPRAAEMFVLRYLEDCSNRDIARITGSSAGVVAVTLFHARAKLRRQFQTFVRGKR